MDGAIISNNIAKVKQLISEGFDVRNYSTFGSSTADLACFNGHAELLELLLDAGSFIEERTLLDAEGDEIIELLERKGLLPIPPEPTRTRKSYKKIIQQNN